MRLLELLLFPLSGVWADDSSRMRSWSSGGRHERSRLGSTAIVVCMCVPLMEKASRPSARRKPAAEKDRQQASRGGHLSDWIQPVPKIEGWV